MYESNLKNANRVQALAPLDRVTIGYLTLPLFIFLIGWFEWWAAGVQSVQRPDGSFSSKPLEDLFPFLSQEEFLENMIVKPPPE
jgi:hypothetical protein